VDSGVRDQIGLEFSDVYVQGSIESQRGSQRGNNLSNQSVEVGVSRSFDVQLSSADVINCFVIQHNSHISVFQQGVGGKDTVVRFNNSSGDLRGRIDSES